MLPADIRCGKIEVSERGAFYDALDASGKHLWYVATHTYQQPDGSWSPKVRPGTFTCQRGAHTIPTGESFDTFEVLGVPGHSGILFVHPGNLPQKDSDGCFICGLSLGYVSNDRAVIVSREAFKVFTANRAGIDRFQLVVE